ncbi:MAG: nucleotidyltransferase [Methanobacterium sp.]
MELPSYFLDFLFNIRLTSEQVDNLKEGHKNLCELLEKDKELSNIIETTFLQGSYRRSTITKPKGNENPDVDVIVVTNLDKDTCPPIDALEMFIPFLEENYDDYRVQGRSLGISLDNVDLDLVVTAAPSKSEESLIKKMVLLSDLSIEDMLNKSPDTTINLAFQETFSKKQDAVEWTMEPLYIPDREADKWEPTHPLEQIRWTTEKNKNTNSHYVNVVKALKWWKKENHPDAENPKSYPFEHFIGDCCPNGIESVAEGITRTLEKMVDFENKPILHDRGVPEHDVFERITNEEYEIFHSQVSEAALIAKEALDSTKIRDSVLKWQELLGNEFPNPTTTERTEKTERVPRSRYA